MSGRIYLLLAAWGVVSFFALGALLCAASRAVPRWSRQMREEAERQWEGVQTAAAVVPQTLRDFPPLPDSSAFLPREADYQI